MKKNPFNIIYAMSQLTFRMFVICSIMLQISLAGNISGQSLESIHLSFDFRNTRLSEVFTQIEQSTGYTFFYNSNMRALKKRITISADNVPMDELLQDLSNLTGLHFRAIENTISVKEVQRQNEESLQQQVSEKTIKGRVTDGDTGETLVGVNVVVPQTTIGTVTDTVGNFTLRIPETTTTLSFSLIGYRTQQVAIAGRTELAVVLSADVVQLREFIVTALGIRREEKALGYSTQSIDGNEFNETRTTNWASSLSGRVAGLNNLGASTGPTASQRITLMGESSLNLDNNEALIVLDGVPINNRITGTGFGGHLNADSPVDYGSALNNINPDDIENVTILKGPAAAALYGSRAANGVILINTKAGSKRTGGIGVTYNTNVTTERIGLRWIDLQFEYGEGRTDQYYSYLDSEDGPNTSTGVAAGRAWGPKFNGQMYYQYNPNSPDGRPTEKTPWVPYYDYISGFFKPAWTFSNNVAIDGSTDRSSARVSLTHMKNDWIMPNTGFERVSASIAFDHKVTDRFIVNSRVNYVNLFSDNLPMSGYNNQSVMYFMIIGTAPNIDINWFKPLWKDGLENVEQHNPFNPGPENPYLQAYQMLNKQSRHGLIGNISANYEISPKMNFLIRTGMDMANEERSQQRPFSLTKFPRGMYRQQSVFNYEINTDFLITYKERLGKNFGAVLNFGGNNMMQHYNFNGMYADRLAMPGVFMISNSLDQAVADPSTRKRQINSLYAFTQFDYKEMVFIDMTGRNDWSSTLPAQNNSFFYPSINTSLLFNETGIGV